MHRLRIGLLLACIVMLTACADNVNSSEDTELVRSEAYSAEKDSENGAVESDEDYNAGNLSETAQADDEAEDTTDAVQPGNASEKTDETSQTDNTAKNTSEDSAKTTQTDESDEIETIYLKPCDNYQDILDNAYAVITNQYADIVGADDIFEYTGIWEAGMGRSTDEALARIGYVFYDVDGNGIEELIIVDTPDPDGSPWEWDNRIILMYSLADDKPVLLIAGVVRGRYYLLNDNTIYHEGSSGAFDNVVATYRMAKGGVSLETIDFYYTGYRDNSVKGYELIEGNLGWFHNTTGSKNSESEWVGSELPQEIQEIEREQVKDLDVTFFETLKQ